MKTALKHSLLIFCLLLNMACLAQPDNWQPYDTLEIATIRHTTDREGNLYFSDKSGTLFKYVFADRQLMPYRSAESYPPDLIEAGQTVRVFLFNRERSACQWVSRRLTPARDGEGTIWQPLPSCQLATPAADGSVWLWQSGGTLLKYNPRLDRAFSQTAVRTRLRPTHMREYQHRLYISWESGGVSAFDSFGTLSEQIDTPALSYLSFVGDSLVFLESGHVVRQSLYSQKRRNEHLPIAAESIALTEQTAYLFFEGRILIYRLEN